jgi:hypothetical protein
MARPMRTGALIAANSMSAHGGGIIASIETVEVGNLAVFFLVANARIEDKAGVCVRGQGIAKI